MTELPQLCLGTVQFGLPYGVTNQSGQVPEDEVRRILGLAASSGISFLDTAKAYGTAETLLGNYWPIDAPRRLISKLPAGAPRQSWEESLISSLQCLQAASLDSFLLHRASDLLASDGPALLHWLDSLRNRGLVERIGVSIYDASELEGLPLDHMQLVQLPLSVFNQRLIRDGTLERLRDFGIAVHVRSVLLQGVMVQPIQNWPDHLSLPFRAHHARWFDYLQKNGLSPLAGALGFVRSCEAVEAVLIGVNSEKELKEVLEAWTQDLDFWNEDMLHWTWENLYDIDPRLWP